MVLPATAYTEKAASYCNTEGRMQVAALIPGGVTISNSNPLTHPGRMRVRARWFLSPPSLPALLLLLCSLLSCSASPLSSSALLPSCSAPWLVGWVGRLSASAPASETEQENSESNPRDSRGEGDR